MNAKEKVRAIYPQARHERYVKNDHSRYTLIWSAYGRDAKRLGEGKTTVAAWRDAAKRLK